MPTISLQTAPILRNDNSIHAQHNLFFTERSCMCMKLYNSLSKPIREIENSEKFRKKIHNLLIIHKPYIELGFLAETAHT